MEDNREDVLLDMELVATSLILQGSLTIVYSGRDDNVKDFSNPFED